VTRIALVSSEPVRPLMAGIGLRYAEFARRLADAGLDVLLISPATAEVAAEAVADGRVRCERFDPSLLAQRLGRCDAWVGQGQLANDALLAGPDVASAIDLYDPWLVENLHYAPALGFDPYRNDHATWLLQLGRGDFFLCSSAEQRLFYLGFLTALGRVHPSNVASDPELERLIAAVPFGVPDTLPPYRPYLPPRRGREARILFGAVYDWYDPWTLLQALESLDFAARPWRLLLVRHPNAEATPQNRLAEIERWCRQRSWWGEGGRVEAIDWVPGDRRFDLLRDVDLLAATHAPGLETDLAMRTRYLDALAAGCPVLTSAGGSIARLLEGDGSGAAGWVVPALDVAATATAVREAFEPGPPRDRRVSAALVLAREFRWSRVVAPLVRFCAEPWRDATKAQFSATLRTAAPPDALGFRVRRRIRRWVRPA
jgi:hypothetical protein